MALKAVVGEFWRHIGPQLHKLPPTFRLGQVLRAERLPVPASLVKASMTFQCKVSVRSAVRHAARTRGDRHRRAPPPPARQATLRIAAGWNDHASACRPRARRVGQKEWLAAYRGVECLFDDARQHSSLQRTVVAVDIRKDPISVGTRRNSAGRRFQPFEQNCRCQFAHALQQPAIRRRCFGILDLQSCGILNERRVAGEGQLVSTPVGRDNVQPPFAPTTISTLHGGKIGVLVGAEQTLLPDFVQRLVGKAYGL